MAGSQVQSIGGKNKVVVGIEAEEIAALHLDPLRRFLAGIEAAGEDGAHSAEDVGIIGAALLRGAQDRIDADMRSARASGSKMDLMVPAQ